MVETAPAQTRSVELSPTTTSRPQPRPRKDGAPTSFETETSPAERAVHDVVTLSEGGQKIVNLARSQELAADLRQETDPVVFASKLRQALEDIRRITRLFAEVLKAAFSRSVRF